MLGLFYLYVDISTVILLNIDHLKKELVINQWFYYPC